MRHFSAAGPSSAILSSCGARRRLFDFEAACRNSSPPLHAAGVALLSYRAIFGRVRRSPSSEGACIKSSLISTAGVGAQAAPHVLDVAGACNLSIYLK